MHDKMRGRRVRGGALVASLVTAVVISAGSGPGLAVSLPSHARAGVAASGHRMALMRAAAREFGVPAGLLLAISYDQTRWARPGGSPSVDGGYGLMDLTARTFPRRQRDAGAKLGDQPVDGVGLAEVDHPHLLGLASE